MPATTPSTIFSPQHAQVTIGAAEQHCQRQRGDQSRPDCAAPASLTWRPRPVQALTVIDLRTARHAETANKIRSGGQHSQGTEGATALVGARRTRTAPPTAAPRPGPRERGPHD